MISKEEKLERIEYTVRKLVTLGSTLLLMSVSVFKKNYGKEDRELKDIIEVLPKTFKEILLEKTSNSHSFCFAQEYCEELTKLIWDDFFSELEDISKIEDRYSRILAVEKTSRELVNEFIVELSTDRLIRSSF